MSDIAPGLLSALADRYRIERALGAGGMATVYLAHDSKHDRQVAIKVLKPELARSLAGDRFLREIAITARLNHPHILTLLDSGAVADGEFLYYVMPLATGQSLRDRITAHGALPVSEALRIACDTVEALVHAHGCGVVHRDIKPDNILISEGHAIVVDFGIAKAVGSAREAQMLTSEGTSLGTPTYMAPEQAAGESDVDHRADIYAIGAVLYEMLAGQPPFAGDYLQVVMAKMGRDAPSLSVHAPTAPPELTRLVARCLARDAAQRPATAERLLEELRDLSQSGAMRRQGLTGGTALQPAVIAAVVVVGLGVAAYSLLPAAGAPAWAVPATLGLVFLGLLLAAWRMWTLKSSWQGETHAARANPSALHDAVTASSRPASVTPTAVGPDAAADAWTPDPKAIAVLPFRNMSEDSSNEYFSDGVTEDILTHLSQIADLHVISRTSVMAYKTSTVSLGQIARELRVGTVLEGSVRKAGDRVRVTAQLIEAHTDRHLWAETYDRNLDDIFAVQSDVAQQIAMALQARLAPAVLTHIRARPSHDMKAYELFVRGRQDAYSVHPDRIPRAVAQLNEALVRDPTFASAHAMLGFTHMVAGYWGGASPLRAFQQAKASAGQAVSLDDRTALGWAILGVMRAHLDYDWPAATDELRHAVDVGPGVEDAHFWLGFVLLLQERFAEARASYELASALDPHNPVMASHLAAATWLLKGGTEAERAFERIAADHPSVADVHAMHSVSLSRHGRWIDFAEANRKGAELTGGHPIFRAREALGLQRGGRVAEAAALVAEIRARPEEELTSGIRLVLALVEDDHDAAGRFLDQAIEERQPMVLWYRVMGILPREEPWVRERFQSIWPES